VIERHKGRIEQAPIAGDEMAAKQKVDGVRMRKLRRRAEAAVAEVGLRDQLCGGCVQIGCCFGTGRARRNWSAARVTSSRRSR